MIIHSKVKFANQDLSLKGETRPALNIVMVVIGKLPLEFNSNQSSLTPLIKGGE